MLTISNSPDLLLSDELSVDEKLSRDINSSSLSVSFREKIALRDFLRHNNETRYQSPRTQVCKIFYYFRRHEKVLFAIFQEISFFFSKFIHTNLIKKSKKKITFQSKEKKNP